MNPWRYLTERMRRERARARLSVFRVLVLTTVALLSITAVVAFLWLPLSLTDRIDEVRAGTEELRVALFAAARAEVERNVQTRAAAALPAILAAQADPLVSRGGVALYVDGRRLLPAPDACEEPAAPPDDESEAFVKAVEEAGPAADALRVPLAAALAHDANLKRRADVRFADRRRIVAALLARRDVDGALLRALVIGELRTGEVRHESLQRMYLRAMPWLCDRAASSHATVRDATLAVGGTFEGVEQRLAERRDDARQFPLELAGAVTAPAAMQGPLALVPTQVGVLAFTIPRDLTLFEQTRWGTQSARASIIWPTTVQPISRVDISLAAPSLMARHQLEAGLGRLAIYGVGSVVGLVLMAAAAAAVVWRRVQKLGQLRRDLVAAVTHELRTPLASMRLQIDALDRRFDKDAEDPRARAQLERLGRDVDSLEGLVENVLSYGRLSRGGVRLVLGLVQLKQLVDGVAARQRALTPHAAIVVDGSDPEVVADAEIVQIVVSNLIANAVRHNPKADPQVRVVIDKDADAVRVSVEDNGVGVDAEQRERIFRPFERALSLSRGAGLGLTIAREMARLHGGDVRLVKSGSAGSVFEVVLPLEAPRT